MEGDKLYQYEFTVGMTCNGCKNAIDKLLGTEACKLFKNSIFLQISRAGTPLLKRRNLLLLEEMVLKNRSLPDCLSG